MGTPKLLKALTLNPVYFSIKAVCVRKLESFYGTSLGFLLFDGSLVSLITVTDGWILMNILILALQSIAKNENYLSEAVPTSNYSKCFVGVYYQFGFEPGLDPV